MKQPRVFRPLVGYGIVSFAILQIIEAIMHGLSLPPVGAARDGHRLGLGFPNHAHKPTPVAVLAKRAAPLGIKFRAFWRLITVETKSVIRLWRKQRDGSFHDYSKGAALRPVALSGHRLNSVVVLAFEKLGQTVIMHTLKTPSLARQAFGSFLALMDPCAPRSPIRRRFSVRRSLAPAWWRATNTYAVGAKPEAEGVTQRGIQTVRCGAAGSAA